MLLINLQNSVNRLIISASAFGVISTECKLEIYSAFDKKSYSFNMVQTSSLFTERFNEFIFPSATFTNLEPGVYSYKIVDGEVVYNIGMLKIISNDKTEDERIEDMYLSIEPDDSEDDYIVID